MTFGPIFLICVHPLPIDLYVVNRWTLDGGMSMDQEMEQRNDEVKVERPEDRRTAPRYNCELQTEIRQREKVFSGRISNLSVVGARVNTDAPLGDDEDFEVRLFLVQADEPEKSDGIDSIVVVGTVVWTLESDDCVFMSGLRFELMGPHELERLRRFLRRLANG